MTPLSPPPGPHTHLWSWCHGGSLCVSVGPWWPEGMRACARAGPPASAPAGTPRWPPGPLQGRRREPLRSRPPDRRSAWSQSHKPSDGHREGQVWRSEIIQALHGEFVVWCWRWKKKNTTHDGWHLSRVSHSLRCCYYQTAHLLFFFSWKPIFVLLWCTIVLWCIIRWIILLWCTHSSILNELWTVYESTQY